MSYWNRPTSTILPLLDSTSIFSGMRSANSNGGGDKSDEFYEIEPAIVLDIILDIDHPYLESKVLTLIPSQWPVDINGKPPVTIVNVNGKSVSKPDKDYTWIGKALIRLINSHKNVEKEDLIWATPLESNISEYPVLNEVVGVVYYLGQYYYTRKINKFNTPNANADFNLELIGGGFTNPSLSLTSPILGNRELLVKTTDPKKPYAGPPSKLNFLGTNGYKGVLGRYFYYNPRIRSLKRREGDMIFESRFGQSIRFAAYDDNRNNDKSSIDYTDYKGNGIQNPAFPGKESGGGNPMIIIRNRQRPLNTTSKDEKNVGGYMLEDINNDGTSIHITSGVTLSAFRNTCIKKMWGNGSEEKSEFNGQTSFVYPKLMGDQIVINSDRVIVSSKKGEMFHYSKKRMSSITDDEYTIDAQNQIVITTNNKTVLNSPAIYLGEYNQTNEPVLLGQTSVNWLYDLCDWLKIHTHWYRHTHPDAQGGTTGMSNPQKTQTTVQSASLIILRDKLNLLMSRRVFTVGGGLALGIDGGTISNGESPVKITIPSGEGVPGGWSGSNRKYSSSEKQSVKTLIEETKVAAAATIAPAAAAKVSAIAANKTATGINMLFALAANNIPAILALNAVNVQSNLSRANSTLANKYLKDAQDAVKTAETTDNEAARIEANVTAKDAADKAKYYANLAEKNNKAATSAAATTRKILGQ